MSLRGSVDRLSAEGASGWIFDNVEVRPHDIALIGSRTLYRLRTPEGATAVTTWCAPARVSPMNFVAAEAGTFTVRHFSSAMLMV